MPPLALLFVLLLHFAVLLLRKIFILYAQVENMQMVGRGSAQGTVQHNIEKNRSLKDDHLSCHSERSEESRSRLYDNTQVVIYIMRNNKI